MRGERFLLCFDVLGLKLDQLENDHLGGVAATGSQLVDAGVAAGAVLLSVAGLVLGADLAEELFHHRMLVVLGALLIVSLLLVGLLLALFSTILGHRNRHTSTMFYRLSEVRKGDKVSFVKQDGTKLDYKVKEVRFCSPKKLVNNIVSGASDSEQLTLVSCATELGKGFRRLVICVPA